MASSLHKKFPTSGLPRDACSLSQTNNSSSPAPHGCSCAGVMVRSRVGNLGVILKLNNHTGSHGNIHPCMGFLMRGTVNPHSPSDWTVPGGRVGSGAWVLLALLAGWQASDGAVSCWSRGRLNIHVGITPPGAFVRPVRRLFGKLNSDSFQHFPSVTVPFWLWKQMGIFTFGFREEHVKSKLSFFSK